MGGRWKSERKEAVNTPLTGVVFLLCRHHARSVDFSGMDLEWITAVVRRLISLRIFFFFLKCNLITWTHSALQISLPSQSPPPALIISPFIFCLILLISLTLLFQYLVHYLSVL